MQKMVAYKRCYMNTHINVDYPYIILFQILILFHLSKMNNWHFSITRVIYVMYHFIVQKKAVGKQHLRKISI